MSAHKFHGPKGVGMLYSYTTYTLTICSMVVNKREKRQCQH
ncbi:MAG: hypothetical protein ACLUCE_08155 [Streptococcus sp.]